VNGWTQFTLIQGWISMNIDSSLNVCCVQPYYSIIEIVQTLKSRLQHWNFIDENVESLHNSNQLTSTLSWQCFIEVETSLQWRLVQNLLLSLVLRLISSSRF